VVVLELYDMRDKKNKKIGHFFKTQVDMDRRFRSTISVDLMLARGRRRRRRSQLRGRRRRTAGRRHRVVPVSPTAAPRQRRHAEEGKAVAQKGIDMSRKALLGERRDVGLF